MRMRMAGIQGAVSSQQTPLHLYLLKRINRYLANRVRTLRIGLCRLTHRTVPLELREQYLFRHHNSILKRYIPQPYYGPIALFRGPAGDRWPYNEPELGWKDIARGELKIISIDAPHLEFMEPPELGIQLAGELRAVQDKRKVT